MEQDLKTERRRQVRALHAAAPAARTLIAGALRNKLEIQFFGLQRTGNHAVLSWLFQQFDKPVYFFNNIQHFADPVLNFHFADVPNAVPVRRGPRPEMLKRLEHIRLQKKHVLVLSYENLRLAKLARHELVGDRENLLGASEKICRVLLLRDFYNWIASRIRLFEEKKQPVPSAESVDAHISLWLAYAKEYLGETNFLGSGQVVTICYNRWVKDEVYRAYLLGRMDLPFKDNSNTHVPDVGGGSSFDAKIYSGRPEEMRTTERWRYLLEEKFSHLLEPIKKRRDEIERYNRAIFQLEPPF